MKTRKSNHMIIGIQTLKILERSSITDTVSVEAVGGCPQSDVLAVLMSVKQMPEYHLITSCLPYPHLSPDPQNTFSEEK